MKKKSAVEPLRTSDPGLLILIAVADGPKHGYAMLNEIETLAGVRPGPGTLYGAITRLEEQGLIEPLESDDRRTPYQLTPEGRRHLGTQLRTMESLARIGTRRLATA
ncbi:MAG: PadR family transcriptional regulator [Vicinamibacteria bacterium]